MIGNGDKVAAGGGSGGGDSGGGTSAVYYPHYTPSAADLSTSMARRAVEAALAGQPPTVLPEACGPWGAVLRTLQEAPTPEAARRAWAAMTRAHPDLWWICAGGEAGPAAGNGRLAVRLSEVEPVGVRWLFFPYLPLSKITLLEGDPGVGKSWLSAALSVAVSLGRPLLPDMPPPPGPGRALILTAEDDLSDTLRPRLEGMGANLESIWAAEASLDLATEEGRAALSREVEEIRPALVIIDPITAFLGAQVDIHRANTVRAALAPLARLAAQYEMAVLLLRHLTKAGGGKPLYRGLGTIDFSAAARSILLAGINPDNPQERAVFHIKSNVGPIGPALGYKIEGDGDVARFSWTGRTTLTVAQVLGGGSGDEEGPALREAQDFLREMLADGPMAAQELLEKARGAGIAKRTLERARAALGVVAYQANRQW